MLDGPYAEQHSSFDVDVVTFGRGGDNALVVSTEHASRHHGELRLIDGQWMVIGLSGNGTKVNRRTIGEKPVALRDGDVVGVGRSEMFRVRLADESTPVAAAASADSDAGASAAKNRNRTWMMIGIYWIVIVAVFMALTITFDDEGAKAGEAFTAEQIRAEIQRRSPRVPPDDRLAAIALNEARQYLDQPTSAGSLFFAHQSYKEALAYQGVQQFGAGDDQIAFMDTEQRLIERVTEQYIDANTYLLGGQWDRAKDAFTELAEMYPANTSTSALAKHVSHQIDVAYSKQGKKRRRLR